MRGMNSSCAHFDLHECIPLFAFGTGSLGPVVEVWMDPQGFEVQRGPMVFGLSYQMPSPRGGDPTMATSAT